MSLRSLRMRRPPAIGRLRPTLLRSARPAVPAPPSWRRSIPGRTAAPFRPRAGARRRPSASHTPAKQPRIPPSHPMRRPHIRPANAPATPQPHSQQVEGSKKPQQTGGRRYLHGNDPAVKGHRVRRRIAVGHRFCLGVWNDGFRKKALLCRKRFLGQPGNSRQLRGLERRYAAPGPCRAAPDAARSVRLCDGRYRNARASMSRPLLPPRLGPAPLPACLSGPGIEHNPPPRLLSHASALRKG